MSSLTETAYYTRQGMKIGAVFLVILIILKIIISSAASAWKKAHPAPPPRPETTFGKLTKISFPANELPKITNFQLETPSGELPDFGDRAKVYFVPGFGPQFLALEKAQQIAERLGLNPTPEKIREDVYLFKSGTLGTTLTINVLSGNFQFQYNYLDDQTLINPAALPTKETAVVMANNFLSKIEKLAPDLEEGRVEASYFKIGGQGLVSVPAPSEADLIRIDIFRKEIDNQYPIVSKNPQQSPVNFLISGADTIQKQIVEAVFNYSVIDLEKASTYPIKTSDQAWQELQAGSYYLARLDKKDNQQTTIRQVSLGYFEAFDLSHFLQPVFIFQGDNGFIAYVSAVVPEWVEE